MPLTPADVHNVAFSKPPIGKRGYNEDEVDAFLDLVETELTRLIEEDGDIRWIVKEMPILGPGSELAARAAIATLLAEGPEAYMTLHHRLMGLQGPIDEAVLDEELTAAGLDPAAIRAGMEGEEVTRRLAGTRALAQSLAVSGTPTFVFGDQMVRGYLPLDQMQTLVAALRESE